MLSIAGVADKQLHLLKTQLSSSMSGMASSVLREMMLYRVLAGDRFPSERTSIKTAMAKVRTKVEFVWLWLNIVGFFRPTTRPWRR